jgi:hypothetical protein
VTGTLLRGRLEIWLRAETVMSAMDSLKKWVSLSVTLTQQISLLSLLQQPVVPTDCVM